MQKVIIHEKEIVTNYGTNAMYALVAGNDLRNYRMEHKEFDETYMQFMERLVDKGYTRIRLAEVTTAIKGYHKTIAYCRK